MAGAQLSLPQAQAAGERKASVIFHVSKAFCFDFQETGKEERRVQRSRPFEVIYSLNRRNHEAEFEQRFPQNKSSLRVSLKFPCLHFHPRTTKEGVAGSQPHSSPLCPASGPYPLLLYFLQLAKVGKPASCIKIQMWKTLSASSFNLLLLLLGEKEIFFFFFFCFPSCFYCRMYQMVKG